jgi:predicted P-loop ATPase
MTSNQLVRDAACDYIRRGFKPIPVPRGEKGPKLPDWTTLSISEQEVPHYFKDTHEWNIGLILGEGVADVDCDCLEAVTAAQFVLPRTDFVYGRASKPQSHFFYRVGGGLTLNEQCKDPMDRKMIIELRALKKNGTVGQQSIVPPSLHGDSGEVITFHKNGQPASIDGNELAVLVRRAGAMALLALHWPDNGRHETGLALAGALANSGMAEDDAVKFLTDCYRCVLTHDLAALERTEAEVRDTYRKHEMGENHTGFTSAIAAIPAEVLGQALEWLGYQRTSGAAGWKGKLVRRNNGSIIPILKNAMIALRGAACWQGVLRFNEFSLKTECASVTPWGETVKEWMDHHDARVREWLEGEGIYVKGDVVASAVNAVARENGYHPVRDYLNGLTWDGNERLRRMLADYFGAEDTRLAEEIGRKWMVSAVARVFEPGCQADHMLILEGKQGIGKSTGLRALFEPWFSDDVADFDNKDAQMGMSGVWCIELSELAAIARRETEVVKAFVSRRVDRFRAPYERRLAEHPRQCVFAATTNEHDFLKDATGGRRSWPFEVGTVDRKRIVQDKNQLWAEAVTAYRAGVPWWIVEGEADLLADIQTAQGDRTEHDLWHEPISTYIENQEKTGQNAFTVAELLKGGVNKQVEHCDARDKARVHRVMRQLGYQPMQEPRGERRRYWANHKDAPIFHAAADDNPSVPF